MVAHGIGEALEPLSAVLAEPSDGCRDELDPEEVSHQRGKPLFRQQLVVQQIQHERADAFAVLHRRGHPFGECRPSLRAAGDAPAAIRTVFGHNQRSWLGQIEYLPRDVIRRHRRGQRFAARDAGLWIMVDGGIGPLNPAKRLARVAPLPAGLLARRCPQAADPLRWLVQSVAGRWLAAVAAVQPEAALQFGNARLLRQQQGDECVLRELVERVAIHRLLGIGLPKSCQTKSRPNLRYASQPPQLSPRAPASQQPGQLPISLNTIDVPTPSGALWSPAD